MCNLRSLLQAIHEHAKAKSSDGTEDKWRPIKVHDCQQDACSEDERIFTTFVDFLMKNMKSSIDADSCEPIVESQFPEEFEKFSEINRIVQNKGLKTSEKAELISAPVRQVIDNFTRDFAKICHVKPEIFVYGLILLKRFLRASRWAIRPTTWRPMVLVSIRLAQKIEEEATLSTKTMNYVYPLFSVGEFVDMENILLNIIQYRTYVSIERFTGELQSIYEHTRPRS